MNMHLSTSHVPVRRFMLAAAAGAAVAAVALALMPADVLAAVGGGGNGATEGAKAFKKNGLSTAQSVGAVVFAVVAIVAIARGTVGGKVGQGMVAFGVACLGMGVSVAPEQTMGAIGSWAVGLFES